MPLPKVAIVGRPNVGKSTLFNRLIGKRLALVDDTPGVTRDRREGEVKLGDLRFIAIDTAGLDESGAPDSLAGRIQDQTRAAVADADLVLFVIDARAGLMPLDRHYAAWLRSAGRPILLAANKAESAAAASSADEAYELGLGDPIRLSAAHGEGLAELYHALAARFGAAAGAAEPEPDEPEGELDTDGEDAAPDPDRPLQLAILGRPNAGKSTLVNALLGEERLLTGPEPGITRDSITIDWAWRGRPVRLVDTAGLRRKANITAKLEKLAAADALRAVRFAEVAVLLFDATDPLPNQDLALADLVATEGRALVLAANKWDLIDQGAKTLKVIRDRLEASLPQWRGVPVITLSGQTGKGTDKLMQAVFAQAERWNRRVPTAPLNEWLQGALERHPLPLIDGRRLKIRYATQVKARPPTFALFVNKPLALPDSYQRYLAHGLREAFDLDGVPIRFTLNKGANPYAKGE